MGYVPFKRPRFVMHWHSSRTRFVLSGQGRLCVVRPRQHLITRKLFRKGAAAICSSSVSDPAEAACSRHSPQARCSSTILAQACRRTANKRIHAHNRRFGRIPVECRLALIDYCITANKPDELNATHRIIRHETDHSRLHCALSLATLSLPDAGSSTGAHSDRQLVI